MHLLYSLFPSLRRKAAARHARRAASLTDRGEHDRALGGPLGSR